MRSATLFLGALASSHASETSCTADDESSLLQAHLHKLKKKNAVTMLLESSEGIARSLKSGEPPEAVNNAIAEIRSALEEIGPILQEEHLNAQSQIDQQLDEIQACHSSSEHGSAVMGNLAGELATMTQCMADQTSANQAQELHCSEWSNHAHQLSFPSCSPPSSAGLEGIYSTAQNMQNWIEDQWENIHSKYTACAQATTHATDETARCAPVIAEYDERFCQHELACSLRTACHEHEVSVYNALVSASEEGMVARQEHHHTIEQVDCILHLISAAVEAQETVDDSSLENCRTAVVVDENAGHVEEHLTLSFPAPEAWSGCDAPQPTDPQCTEVDLPQAWSNGQAESSTPLPAATLSQSDSVGGTNVAARPAIPFGSSSLPGYCTNAGAGAGTTLGDGRNIHCFANINDGEYGNAHSWIPGADFNGKLFVGVAFVGTQTISSFSLSRDATGQVDEPVRMRGTFEFQYTTAANPNHETPDSAWVSAGTFTRNTNLRIGFQLSRPVEASGVRLIVSAPSNPFWGACIDELEVY